MAIYKTNAGSNFLQKVVDYIEQNFLKKDYYKLKVILPSGLACLYLQKLLLEKHNTTILPTIIPISEISAESEEIFKIPSEQTSCINGIEERIIIAEIVSSYEKLNYNIVQVLQFAPGLTKLFDELESNNIDIKQLENIPTLDQSEYWQSIYDFLSFAGKERQKYINSLNKLSKISYQKLIFSAELERLTKNDSSQLLIAGLYGSNPIINNFIKDVLKLPNAHVILPPSVDYEDKTRLEPENAFFNLNELITPTGKKISEISLLGESKTSIINKLVTKSNAINIEQEIQYLEFENIFHEAEYIATKARQYLDNNPDANIAIIVSNLQAKEHYGRFLAKNLLTFRDIIGTDITKQSTVSLILLLSNLICSEFSTKLFFNFLSHPLIICSQSNELKKIIIKENRFISNLNAIKELVDTSSDLALKKWFMKIFDLLTIKLTNHKFNAILYSIVSILEKIYPNLWQEQGNTRIADSIAEIVKCNWDFKISEIADFPDILQQLVNGGRIYNASDNSNITICSAGDAALVDFDLVFISDLNEDVYPQSKASPWINKHIQKELNLTYWQSFFGNQLYDFYLNLHNRNVILTRSKRQEATKQFLPSPFLLKLEHILGKKLVKKYGKIDISIKSKYTENQYVTSSIFPTRISATDIETMIKAPYNFYAKKILKLKADDQIDEVPTLAEFGNFFHSVIDNYTKNYETIKSDKLSGILSIGQGILNKSIFPNNIRKNWQHKLSAISQDFIDFDDDRRLKSHNIYSEIKGSINLNIAGHDLTVVAVADRIEVDEQGRAVIIDYKTGAIPTKNDVLSGLSPQLIIESLIMLEGGFGIKAQEVKSLMYVKVNSSKPYIKTMEIAISHQELTEHKKGLVKLLEHYITTGKYQTDINLLKYDNYAHLARRL